MCFFLFFFFSIDTIFLLYPLIYIDNIANNFSSFTLMLVSLALWVVWSLWRSDRCSTVPWLYHSFHNTLADLGSLSDCISSISVGIGPCCNLARILDKKDKKMWSTLLCQVRTPNSEDRGNLTPPHRAIINVWIWLNIYDSKIELYAIYRDTIWRSIWGLKGQYLTFSLRFKVPVSGVKFKV